MIEPHSAQLGASSWILKATFVVPSESVTVDFPAPLPFDVGAWPLAAWPLPFARTVSDSPAAEETAAGESPWAEASGFDSVFVGSGLVSTAVVAFGSFGLSSVAGSGSAGADLGAE